MSENNSNHTSEFLRHNFLKRRELSDHQEAPTYRLSIREKVSNGLAVDEDAWLEVPPVVSRYQDVPLDDPELLAEIGLRPVQDS